jgi:hypothetical protein
MADQYSIIQSTGDSAYPFFSMQGMGIVDGRRQAIDGATLSAKYLFLENYSEEYVANWVFEEIPLTTNKVPKYTTTDRFIEISFKLAARNVHEAKRNLDFCTKLARTTLPSTITGGTFDEPISTYGNARQYLINFGTLLRDQLVDVISYDLTMNFEDGVFDYGSTIIGTIDPQVPSVGRRSDNHWAAMGGPSDLMQETEYLYHGQYGGVLAKSVTVSLKLQAYRGGADGDEPGQLGFGGTLRDVASVGWALRPHRSLDWPHGTGPIAAAAYCQRDPVSASPSAAIVDRGDSESVSDDDPFIVQPGTPGFGTGNTED